MATSLTQEDLNFLRLAGLLIKIAPRAVKRRFDYEIHPRELKQLLSKNRRTIDDLTYKKRVITLAQCSLLYPGGSSEVSSDMFDVSLMVCLLRHFTDLDIQESLPLETTITTAADISRIKFYRNYIVHSDSHNVTENEFSKIWSCVSEAILRLAPDLKSEIDALMSATFTNDRDMKQLIRLEKQIENTNQHLKTISQTLETLETENNNKREIHKRTLIKWKDKDKKYISTLATAFVVQSLKHNTGVIITGSPGCGKSVAAHHVALTFETEGYEVVPCEDPSEIVTHFKTEKIQVFVIDDICGKFALNQHEADSWEQNDGKLSMLIESCHQKDDNENITRKSKTKFIITCRENIYSHKAFPKLTCFSLIQCNFSTSYKTSKDEMKKIALAYVSEDTVNHIQNVCLYDFFPLLCDLYCTKANRDLRFFTHPVEIIKNEISEMKIKSESSFLCLSLLVLKNNNISKDDCRSLDVKQLVKDVCRECDIESFVSMVSVQTSFESLKGIYINEAENIYSTIHDKMFDIISAAIAPFIMNCLIKYVDIAFLVHRIQFLSLDRSCHPDVVYIPLELERSYLKRQYNEVIKGNYWEVIGSVQSENEAYRKLLLSFLDEEDICQEITYLPDKEGTTPLFVSCYLGYVDFVEYFIVKSPFHLNVKDKEGRSPFYVACENGHIKTVRYLITCHHDINAEINEKIKKIHSNKDGLTALHAACNYGHREVVKLLIEIGMNINDKSNTGVTPLSVACRKGHFNTVKYLLDLNGQTLKSRANTAIRDNNGWSVLHMACSNGHTQVVKHLIEIGININVTSNSGSTPVFLACQRGHYDIVKFLLDLNDRILNSRVNTNTRDTHGWSVLHVACSNGHTEVVKLLIEIGMNINDTSSRGFTPLFLACREGHYDTVKFLSLLDGNNQTFKSRVDTTTRDKNGWSVLHAACSNGHTEVVTFLIEIDMNINVKSNRGSTPLYIACRSGHYDTVKFLLDLNGDLLNSRVDTLTRNENGWSVIHGACYNGHTQIVKLLVEISMNINDTSYSGSTPIHIACGRGHYDTVKYLLDLNGQILNSRVDTRIRDKHGCTVLHAACLKGHTQVAKLLIEIGVNLNDTSTRGCTPLYLACQEGHYDTVKFLLDLNGQTLNSRVDTSIEDTNGRSVFYAAFSNRHLEVFYLLIDVCLSLNKRRQTMEKMNV